MRGVSIPVALLLGYLFALAAGVINGVLIAYVEIPALFATLGMASFVYGFARYALVPLYVVYMPASASGIAWIGGGFVFGVPTPILFFAFIALLGFAVSALHQAGAVRLRDRRQFRRRAHFRRARCVRSSSCNTRFPRRCAYVAGMITATAVSSMNTAIVDSSMIYDVILVVVLGGIGLSGGRGGIRNVIVGTLLIGILLNGMTIMDIQYTMQNVIRSLILLAAIVLDSIVNPRDEQTAQQGDI